MGWKELTPHLLSRLCPVLKPGESPNIRLEK